MCISRRAIQKQVGHGRSRGTCRWARQNKQVETVMADLDGEPACGGDAG